MSPYICGDKRLGPVTLLAGILLEGMVGLGSTYCCFGGLYPGYFLAKYWNRTLLWFDYPNYGGYSLDLIGRLAKFNLTLQLGDLIDCFCSENGIYTALVGTPYAMRSLLLVNLNADADSKYLYNNYVYIVRKNIVG
ncbi:hemagglutination repeat-containing protein [Colletotrichum asianum]